VRSPIARKLNQTHAAKPPGRTRERPRRPLTQESGSESPEAYERLILDAMRGDATLFTRDDEIEALWGIIDPILTA
jgi:glucose-6-phosphate 1-dehydrogenase